MKKIYESKQKYSKKYNKENINVQLNRELIETMKEKISGITMKDYIEKLIKESLKQ